MNWRLCRREFSRCSMNCVLRTRELRGEPPQESELTALPSWIFAVAQWIEHCVFVNCAESLRRLIECLFARYWYIFTSLLFLTLRYGKITNKSHNANEVGNSWKATPFNSRLHCNQFTSVGQFTIEYARSKLQTRTIRHITSPWWLTTNYNIKSVFVKNTLPFICSVF